jgi:hypothetical protein
MRCAAICGLSGSANFFQHYSINGAIFEKKKKKKKKGVKYELGVFIFSIILSETFLVLRIIKRDIIVNVHPLKYPLFFQILIKLEFSNRFSKYTQISNFITIRSVGAALFHEDGRTIRQRDMMKLIVEFRKSANTPIRAKQDSVNKTAIT